MCQCLRHRFFCVNLIHSGVLRISRAEMVSGSFYFNLGLIFFMFVIIFWMKTSFRIETFSDFLTLGKRQFIYRDNLFARMYKALTWNSAREMIMSDVFVCPGFNSIAYGVPTPCSKLPEHFVFCRHFCFRSTAWSIWASTSLMITGPLEKSLASNCLSVREPEAAARWPTVHCQLNG